MRYHICVIIYITVTAYWTGICCITALCAGWLGHFFFIAVSFCRYNSPTVNIFYWFIAVVIFIITAVKVTIIIFLFTIFCTSRLCTLTILCQFLKRYILTFRIAFSNTSASAVYCKIITTLKSIFAYQCSTVVNSYTIQNTTVDKSTSAYFCDTFGHSYTLQFITPVKSISIYFSNSVRNSRIFQLHTTGK